VNEEFRPLPPHYDRCFGCGPAHPTGLHMEMAGSGMRVKGSFLVSEHHQGAPALAHGGVVAAAMDEAMGFLLWQLGTLAVTAHLEVDFRRPVPMGSRLALEGQVERVEGRKIHARMTARIDDDVVAESKALFIKVGAGHFAPHASRIGAGTPTYNP
jgi:acyl-coenzyme A thioesterase PaaI-like protein